jgi:hypothetical protein
VSELVDTDIILAPAGNRGGIARVLHIAHRDACGHGGRDAREWRIDVQTSALNGAGGQSQLIQQLLQLAQANAVQEEGAQAASSTQSTQDSQSATPAATPVSGTTPSDMFSGSTLSALTSAQEGGPGYWRNQIDSDVANQIIDQFGSNGGISLAQVQSALSGSGAAASGGASTTSNTVSTLDSTSSNTASTLDGLASAFASIDTNGDGELSASELTNALNKMQDAQGTGQTQGHHGHHHHHGGGGGDELSLQDIQNALNTLTVALNNAGGSTSGGTSTGSGTTSSNTVSTVDGSTASGGATTASNTTSPNATSTNTVSTLSGLTTTEVTQALQAFLNSLAQSQAANLAALGQSINPTNVTA